MTENKEHGNRSIFNDEMIERQIDKLKFAENLAIGFAEWIDDGLMFMARDKTWVNCKDGITPTTKELYQLYLQSKTKTP